MSDDEERNAWDRQSGETGRAYEAWVTFRSLPYDSRNMEEVGRRLGKSGQQIGKWAKKWGWKERELAWDAHLTDLEIEAEQKRRKQIIDDRLAISQRLKAMTAKHMNRWLVKIEKAEQLIAQGDEHAELPFDVKEIATIYGIAMKIESEYLATVKETAPSMRVYFEDA